MNADLPEQLGERLAGPLPGPEALSRFLVEPSNPRPAEPSTDDRAAAVLVLLYPHHGRWYVPLTLRPANLADHASEISLPGGTIEPGETSSAAAIREFHEELGGSDTTVELLGRLSTRHTVASHFRVDPWVGAAPRRGRMVANPAEVETLLEIPLIHLMNPVHLGSHQRQRDGQVFTAPHFQWRSYRIWGVTCAILGELVTQLRDAEVEV